MQDNLLGVAQDEERRLVAELQNNPLFRKLEAVRSLISAYSRYDAVPASTEATIPVKRADRAGSRASEIAKGARDYLRRIHRRATSSEIMAELEKEGLTFPGDKPVGAVASILSHNELFDNVRGAGYGLVEWNGESISSRSTTTTAHLPTETLISPREGTIAVDPVASSASGETHSP